jgi:hypothetical protein
MPLHRCCVPGEQGRHVWQPRVSCGDGVGGVDLVSDCLLCPFSGGRCVFVRVNASVCLCMRVCVLVQVLV